MGTWKALELLLLAESRLNLTLKSCELTAWLIAASFPESSSYHDELGFSGWLSSSSCRDSGEGCSFLPLVKVLWWRGCPRICPASTSCICFSQWGSVLTCSVLNWNRSCVVAFCSQAKRETASHQLRQILTRTLLFNSVVGLTRGSLNHQATDGNRGSI